MADHRMNRDQRRKSRRGPKGQRRRMRAAVDGTEPLEVMPPSTWPNVPAPGLLRAWRNTTLLVQEYDAGHYVPGAVRLSVQRCDARDGLSWDDLAAVLHQLHPKRWAVECYPPPDRVVNVANMRHLWVYPAGTQPPYTLRSHQ